ncbi:hypothetical protein AJ80_08900 [Polytolypa hystricis UAMH7299]|uniref:Uncharacterized protein n=1 Tax=Polytolypa hystricis (strain UAMH7299) TaxID=1447883 RepID=A0A2B7X035_POLH7|nr:hypothetical protein AJ80_08900 [Polytolypa hystricis UAMH7299]
MQIINVLLAAAMLVLPALGAPTQNEILETRINQDKLEACEMKCLPKIPVCERLWVSSSPPFTLYLSLDAGSAVQSCEGTPSRLKQLLAVIGPATYSRAGYR